MDRALGPWLMKLSVEDVYRWGLHACGPFTGTATGLVKSCFTSFYLYTQAVARGGAKRDGGWVGEGD